MKTKNFLLAGIAGGIVNYLLGWLCYGFLFKNTFPQPEETSETMLYIFLGCLMYGLLLAYIFCQWAQIATFKTGAKAGAIIGLLIGLYYNFFNLAMHSETTTNMAALDVVLITIMSAIVGGIIGVFNGKIK